MSDIIKTLATVSGLTQEDIHKIKEEILANNMKLGLCTGPHRFTILAGRRKFADDSICELCGGRVSLTDKLWYEKGVEHGRRTSDV